MIAQMNEFVPRRWLRGGHRMTLFGWGNPRYFPLLPQPTIRYFDTTPDSRVLALADNRSEQVILADLDLAQATGKYAADSLAHPRFLSAEWKRMLRKVRAQARHNATLE